MTVLTPQELEVKRAKIARLMRELMGSYRLAYDLGYTPTIRSYEKTSGGGDSDPTGEIVADRRKQRIREAVDGVSEEVERFLEYLADAKIQMERASGSRIRSWDVAGARAAEARAERRRVG